VRLEASAMAEVVGKLVADDAKMPHLPKPKKGRKPKRITTKNPPGGPRTPGAKRKR
jgi:hypothetical protein